MSDEEKKCNCGSELGRFFTLVAAIFLGVLLAILVSAALLKPKCPCRGPMPFPPRPMYERQIPPMAGHWGVKTHKMHYQGAPNFGKMRIKKYNEDFQPPVRPKKVNIQK